MPHNNLHYWLRGYKWSTKNQNKNSQNCHCRGPFFGQWKLLSWFSDFQTSLFSVKASLLLKWLTHFQDCPDKKNEPLNSSQRLTLNVAWHIYGIVFWHTIMSSMDAYKWHLNLFCVETKPKKNANEMHRVLQNSSEKLRWSAKKIRKNNRSLQSSWRASGTNFFRLVPDTILEKNQKLKNEFPKTTCVAFKKNLEKNLNFFQQVNCPNFLAKVIKLFTEKKSSKSFLTKSSYRDHVLHLLALN